VETNFQFRDQPCKKAESHWLGVKLIFLFSLVP